jgi:hypothetical protein
MLWVRIPIRRDVLDTTLCNKVCQWLAAGRWFVPATPVSSTNKTERHDITEIVLKVALATMKQISVMLILKTKNNISFNEWKCYYPIQYIKKCWVKLLSDYNIKCICTIYTRLDTCLMSISRFSLRIKCCFYTQNDCMNI